jgi:hypothetical protein
MFRVKSKLCLGVLVIIASCLGYADAVENPYTNSTDEELTQLAADWHSLNHVERRDFFTEVRRRMDANGAKQSMPTLRRFGHIVRQADGTVLRIEGVMRYETLSDGIEQPGYGAGFEQRAAKEELAPEQAKSAPIITVNQP